MADENVANTGKKRPVMVWSESKDELLCREILLYEPFQYKERTRERGNSWKMIAESLNSVKEHVFRVDLRAVRERFNVIKTNYEKKNREEEAASGISPEETELDAAIRDIVERMKEFNIQFSQQSEKKAEKTEHDKKIAEDFRQQALETFSETKKRKGEDDDCGKVKRRSSGSDTVQFLREKAESDRDVKLQELEVRKKEHELQLAQHNAISSQQTEMFKIMMDQQQKQQEQTQQFMLLIAQMMNTKNN